MRRKTLYILLSVLVILGVAASSSWWGHYLGLGGTSLKNTEVSFSTFRERTTDRISIAKSGAEEKVISKENGVWKVGGLDASQEKVDAFFETLGTLTVESLVSKNPANHANFDVTEEDGTMLILSKGDAETAFMIGKRSANFVSFYVKKQDSDNVYEVTGTLKESLASDFLSEKELRENSAIEEQ